MKLKFNINLNVVKSKKTSSLDSHGIGLRNVREIVCRNNGRFSLEGNGEEVSTKVILNLKSTVDGVIVENMQNYDILLLKEGTFYDCMFGY